MILSILIPTIPEHETKLRALLGQLKKQIRPHLDKVEVLTHYTKSAARRGPTTGAKRNALIDQSRGEYVVFVDADDVISEDYIETILMALNGRPDAVCFQVWYKCKAYEKLVKYSVKYKRDGETEEFYKRLPNHLMPIKRSIAHRVKYPNVTRGEDFEYARRVKRYIRKEVPVNKVLYYYMDL